MSLPYDLIKAESDRVGWPTMYKDDLDVDRSTIDQLIKVEGDDLRFAWGLREGGTHLCQTIDEVFEVNALFSNVWWYWFDSRSLYRFNLEQLIGKL